MVSSILGHQIAGAGLLKQQQQHQQQQPPSARLYAMNTQNLNSYNPEVPISVHSPAAAVAVAAAIDSAKSIGSSQTNNNNNHHNNNSNNNNNPKMGSRRIFTPQFKLQVLESYRNDSDCKGNQRATARKYNIHRRQIQKWLQCESNLRSSVANINQNNVKHQFHNVSHHHHHHHQQQQLQPQQQLQQHLDQQHQHQQQQSQKQPLQMPLATLATAASKNSFFSYHHHQHQQHQQQLQHHHLSTQGHQLCLGDVKGISVTPPPLPDTAVDVLTSANLAAVVAAAMVIPSTTVAKSSSTPVSPSPLRPAVIGGGGASVSASAAIITQSMLQSHNHHNNNSHHQQPQPQHHHHHHHQYSMPYTHTPAHSVPVSVPVLTRHSHIPPQHLQPHHHHYAPYHKHSIPTHTPHVYTQVLTPSQTQQPSAFVPSESLSVHVLSAAATASAAATNMPATITATTTATSTIEKETETERATTGATLLRAEVDERDEVCRNRSDALRELSTSAAAATQTKATTAPTATLAGNSYVHTMGYTSALWHECTQAEAETETETETETEEKGQYLWLPTPVSATMPMDLSLGARRISAAKNSSPAATSACKTESGYEAQLEAKPQPQPPVDEVDADGAAVSEETVVDLTFRKRKVVATRVKAQTEPNADTDTDAEEKPEKLQKFSSATEIQQANIKLENVESGGHVDDDDVDIDVDIDVEVPIEEKSPPVKPVKLFKPYLLDSDDVKSPKSPDHSICSEQRDPIIWSNHPACLSPHSIDSRQDSSRGSNFQSPSVEKYTFPEGIGNGNGNGSGHVSLPGNKPSSSKSALSPTSAPALSPTSFLYPKGSPVSGYESSSSTYSEPTYRLENSDHFGAVKDRTYSVKLQMHTVCKSDELPITARRQSQVQRWLDQETNATTYPPTAEASIIL